ncbi:Hsp20/alpha crystallin family protein [Teredinibacter franksiae]|uniref:Hsp20/alpha crystallin family protein n=1 Tax=Teredinibacter franksiae TaxID=2761453 RepID=UPI001624EC6B|nr:Hsp20 family protein [Teredinibacter franksiae]
MTLRPLNSIFEVSDFLEPPWASYMYSDRAIQHSPRVEVVEKDDMLEISAELPGIKKEDINIFFSHGMLTLDAENQEEKTEEENGKIIRQERRYGKFSRSFDLGSNVQESDINAKLENGVLTISAPRVEKLASQAKRIEVH